MKPDFNELWVYLSASPLTALTITLLAYLVGDWIYQKSGKMPILNPVLIAVILITLGLTTTEIDYWTYFEGAQFVHFLLGPATVALAIPVAKLLKRMRRGFGALMVTLVFGSSTAAISAVVIAEILQASERTVLSLAPKSVTTPIAMGIAERIGGLPSLTAVCVIMTGIIGAMLGPYVLNAAGITSWNARGFAMGVAAHGIGTARAIQVHKDAGAFASLAIGLNGLATATLIPLFYTIWQWWSSLS
ncbi:MAG: LrgB family protein [Alphaproteobacteria bacterium]|jgi:predicted murein hydrolase (TIGR00659 family)|nr:LrgB family protein [Alphaproteobacteria bacterium]